VQNIWGNSVKIGIGLLSFVFAFGVHAQTGHNGVVDNLDELRSLFYEHQDDWLPIALPGDSVLFQDYGLIVPFTASGFPKSFNKRLVSDYSKFSVPVFRITCIEDYFTRQVVVCDGYSGLELWRIASDPLRDPYAYLRFKYGLSAIDSFDGIYASEIQRLDTAKVAADFVLIENRYYADYVLSEEQQRRDEALALSMAPKLMSFPAISTNIEARVEPLTGGSVQLELMWPPSYTGRLEVYAATDLLSNDWNVVSGRIPVSGSSLFWVDEVSTNASKRFYSAGDPDGDLDADGIANGREAILFGTSAFTNDTDGDALLDGEEAHTQSYQVEAVPFEWVDIEQAGNLIVDWDQTSWRGYKTMGIGFGFDMYGTYRTNLNVSKLGYLKFGEPTTHYSNKPLPSTDTDVRDMVAVYWGGMEFNATLGAEVFAVMQGVAPHRSFVVTWKNIPIAYNEGASVTVQAELCENGDILCRYKDLIVGTSDDITGGSSTAGMQDAAGIDGTQFCYRQNGMLTNGLALRYGYEPLLWTTTDPANSDTDFDGMDDGFEAMRYYLDPNYAADAMEDQDNDGLTNLFEFALGTDLNDSDTDNDMLKDVEGC
jgi:hypothetical protein